MTRRTFMGTTAAALGAASAHGAGRSPVPETFASASPVDTRLGVKFIYNGIIHEAAFEGSCRHGDLKGLGREAETAALDKRFARFAKEVGALELPPNVDILKPVSMNLWVEKGNPEIVLETKHLKKLAADADSADLYVVTGGGLPQYTCLRIAETYGKPVVLARTAGWGLDAPAGLRRLGYEGYYESEWDGVVRLIRAMSARKAMGRTRILNVTNFIDQVPKGVVSSIIDLDALKSKYGVGLKFMNYDDFFRRMDGVSADKETRAQAQELAGRLIAGADSSNMTREDMVNSLLFYLTVRRVMEETGCNAFTIECFELCSSMQPWHRRFTPCLTHALLKDEGYPSACEKDLNALLAMLVEMVLARKAAYMGNPDIDVKENILTLHHSDAGRRLRGLAGPDSEYGIHSFTESGFGATLRYDFNREAGEPVTVARFDPTATRLLAARGTVIDGSGLEGYGCAQRVRIRLSDGAEFQRAQQDYGHHLAMVLGDVIAEIRDLADMMKFKAELFL